MELKNIDIEDIFAYTLMAILLFVALCYIMFWIKNFSIAIETFNDMYTDIKHLL
jgi:hypothetical protein